MGFKGLGCISGSISQGEDKGEKLKHDRCRFSLDAAVSPNTEELDALESCGELVREKDRESDSQTKNNISARSASERMGIVMESIVVSIQKRIKL
jgi:hypothetical protein